MPFRPPTLAEVQKRVDAFALWLAFAFYVAFGAVAYWGLWRLSRHWEWAEPLGAVLWAPCGIAAWYVKARIEDMLTGWIRE